MKTFLSLYESTGSVDSAVTPLSAYRNDFSTDIFISYAREDMKRVEPIVRELEKHGWSVFWDPEIPPGETWRGYIKKKLDESRCVLVAWSRLSVTSEWVIAEADEAKKRGILVPVLLDAVEPPFGFSHIHAANLSCWKNDSNSRAFKELVNAVTLKISSSSPSFMNSILGETSVPIPKTAPVIVPSTSMLEALRVMVQNWISVVASIRTWQPKSRQTAIAIVLVMVFIFAVLSYRYLRVTGPSSPSVPETVQPVNASPARPGNFVLIRGGEFTMGSPANESGHESDETQHQVKVSDFYLCKYAVTLAEFKKFIEDSGYQTDAEKDGGSYSWDGISWVKNAGVDWRYGVSGSVRPQSEENHPVLHVSWNDAVAYCKWISKKTGDAFRLPTEAEWEYACRAGTTTPFHTGDNLTTGQANYNGNYPYTNNQKGVYRENTVKVDEFAPNAWGLYHMHGNVWEWCGDRYGDKYYDECKAEGVVENPVGPETGSLRVLRGGGWSFNARSCRSAFRIDVAPDYRSNYAGFRLAFVP